MKGEILEKGKWKKVEPNSKTKKTERTGKRCMTFVHTSTKVNFMMMTYQMVEIVLLIVTCV
jgi:hypothetical protein